jgi:outer membrane protein TolC
MRTVHRLAAAACAARALTTLAPAQAARDTLSIGALQAAAVRRDARVRQLDLLGEQSALRQRGIAAERLPTLGVRAQGQYQSDVTSIPIRIPGVGGVPVPPHDTYDAHLEAREPLYDPTRNGRVAVERAQLAESRSRVRTSLHALRQEVNDAWFRALQLRLQRDEIAAGIADLEARLRVARERIAAGAALESEARMLEAELLRRRQQVGQLDADRDAALAVLEELTGRRIAPSALVLPDTGALDAPAIASLDTMRARPEYAQFARTRDLLEQQRSAAAAELLPRVSAFGRVGYGRPGLDMLARAFDTYWLAGVQVEWTPWNWGGTRRDEEVLALEQRIVDSEEASFTARLERGVERDLASMRQLARALAQDDSIVALRERVLRETRLRFDEGVITSAEYVDRETDLESARVARATHRAQLAEARVRYLTTIGAEIR